MELSPITSNGSYRSRLQQHQQMLQGARLQQLASQQPPFTGQGLQTNSPQSATKGPPSSPSASTKTQSFNLPPKPPLNTSTTQGSGAAQGYSLPPKTGAAAQSPAQVRTRTQESPQRLALGQGTPKLQMKSGVPAAVVVKPPIPPPATQPAADVVSDDVNFVTPQLAVPLSLPAQLSVPLSVPLSITPTIQQPYTAQQVQVKQPQQFLAQQMSPGQPKHHQQYYNPATEPHPKVTPAVSQFTVQQHSTPLQQFAQEQPISQQQFAVPLSQAQQKFSGLKKPPVVSQQGYVVQPQPHMQFLVPLPQQPFSVVHSQSQKQYAIQPTTPMYSALPPPTSQATLPLNPAPIYSLTPKTQYPPASLPQYAPPAPPQVQYGLQEKPGKSSRPVSRTPSRGDSFKKNLGPLQVHNKSSSDPSSRIVPASLETPIVATPPELLPVTVDALPMTSDLLPMTSDLLPITSEPLVETQAHAHVSSSGDSEDLMSVDENMALAEIDKAYASLFEAYGEDYLISDSEEPVTSTLDASESVLGAVQGQPVKPYQTGRNPTHNPAIPFSFEELERALDQALQAAAAEQPNDLAQQVSV